MIEIDYGLMKMRKLESMTANADRRNAGADLVFENTRYDYLIGKDRVTYAESTAHRQVNEAGTYEDRDTSMDPLPVNGPIER